MQALTAESSGEFEESLRVVIQCMCDPFEYYSQVPKLVYRIPSPAKLTHQKFLIHIEDYVFNLVVCRWCFQA